MAGAIRRAAVKLHRWTGLAIAGFLIAVAATGTLLPFTPELDRLFAPARYPAIDPARPIDWLGLRAAAERESGGTVGLMPLAIEDGAAPAFGIAPRPDGRPLAYDELVLDPYTGRVIDRAWSKDLRSGPAQIMPFVYEIHQDLWLGDTGLLLVGTVALAWTIDCLIGFYLTLPGGSRSWWRRWRAAWTVEVPPPSGSRLNYDLHRAIGLWLWPMFFVFAWSGVGFNLRPVYVPVMHALTGFVATDAMPLPARGGPHLTWTAALAAARTHAVEAGRRQGFVVLRERELRYQPELNRYAYAVRTSRDRSDKDANSWINLDARTGALVSTELPTGDRTGNTIDYWLGLLHEAEVFGLPFRIFVSFAGLAVLAVTATGVLIWWRKTQVRSRRRGL